MSGEPAPPREKLSTFSAQPVADLSTPMVIAPTSGPGLVINATMDSSITSNLNSTAIQNAINAAISALQSRFKDPITASIYFRYATTKADNTTPLSGSALAQSNYVIYTGVSWNTYTSALRADATTFNDAVANATLPLSVLTTNVVISSANGRAIGLNTPPVMNSIGGVGSGPGYIYDGIVTLNSSQPFQFTRPTSSGNYDAQRSTEHEIDEILGLGSYIGVLSNYRPQDLFSFSSAGLRSVLTSGSRYFSIDNGVTSIVSFNQNSDGDYGDWLSDSCPQTFPYVQNAFGCTGQFSDVTATSPEAINLDVIGYDLVTGSPVQPVPCVQDTKTACMLNNRFKVSVRYRGAFDNGAADTDALLKPVTGFANPSYETAFFYFNSANNIEMLIKILDQGNTDGQGHPTIAVLFGSATPLRIELTITDTTNGAVKKYTSAFGAMQGTTDFTAFVK